MENIPLPDLSDKNSVATFIATVLLGVVFRFFEKRKLKKKLGEGK